jgi:hypothetical protein
VIAKNQFVKSTLKGQGHRKVQGHRKGHAQCRSLTLTQPTKVGGKYRLSEKLAFAKAV